MSIPTHEKQLIHDVLTNCKFCEYVVVMVCCCFRFRIPRTKQQIEADYQRRKITSKFRQQLETIQDAKMDAMSLKDGEDFFKSCFHFIIHIPPSSTYGIVSHQSIQN